MEIAVYAMPCLVGREHDAAYGLLAQVLKQERGIVTVPAIARGANGKPFFPHCPQLHFSISHSRGAVAVALHDKPIGIDLEKCRPAPRRLSQGADDSTFFRRWTALEASVKREGGRIVMAWREGRSPERLCRVFENVLPGWIIAVCPSEDAPIRWEVNFGGRFSVDKTKNRAIIQP